MRSAEYDAFGPWVLEVTRPDEVPRLYRDAALDLASARLVLKVPRRIERRDASPADHLYDHLLIAGEHELTVLSRDGDRYTTARVPYAGLVRVTNRTVLLDGRLSVVSADGTAVDVDYNGSSEETVERLVHVLRTTYRPDPDHGRLPLHEVPRLLRSLPYEDTALVNRTISLLEREVGARLGGAHGRRPARSWGAWDGLVARLQHRTLQGLCVLVDDHELHLVHRRDWWSTGRKPVYSLAVTRVRRARITAVGAADDPLSDGVRVMRLAAGSAELAIPVPAASSTEAALLAAVPSPLTPAR